ncbi:MAG TPA: TetR/AcrR family transcriptional regulator [Candidatus Binataceae bacterium]|jgi:AcrR family transcriptional regulator|nr:TetR/AcrR family transcriptional regulator [Candidatus Binataceae bacterium]
MSVRERKARERRARREAILAAAAKVFAAHRLEGATVEMVAREAEVAVGTIYLYFCSRDDVFLSLMAERIGRLRARYLEIRARGLAPADEVRAIGAAYLDYLRESRGLFLAQLAVDFGKLPLRLSRPEELERYEQVRRLGRECFNLWRDAVGRLLGGAGEANAAATRAATVIWAALNGAFLLTGDEAIFRDVTGLEAAGLPEETFEFQLAAAEAAAASTRRNGMHPENGNRTANGHGGNGKGAARPSPRRRRKAAPAANG